MKLFKNLLLVLSILLIISCSKDEEIIPENKDNILAENAFLIDSTKIISTSDNSFVLENLSTIRKPKIGEIVLSAPSTNCPDGMIRKIISFTENNNSIIYETEQAGLNDAFTQLYINKEDATTFNDESIFSRNTSVGGSLLSLKFNNKTIGNGVKLNGEVKIKYPKVTIKYEKKKNSLTPQSVIFKTDFELNESNLQLTNTNSSPIHIDEYIWKTINLPDFTVIIPIGNFPFPVKFKQKVEFISLPVELSGKFDMKVLPTATATLGFKFENNSWSNISTYNFNSTSPSIFTQNDFLTNGSVNAEITILKPKYTISPKYASEIKGSLEVASKVKLKIQGNTPNYSLKGSIDVKGSIEHKLNLFFTSFQGNYSITGNLYEITIKEGNWDNSIVGTWNHISTYWCGICESCIPDGQTVSSSCGNITGSPSCSWNFAVTFNDNLTGFDNACGTTNNNFTYSINSSQTLLTVSAPSEPTQNFEILELNSTTLKLKDLTIPSENRIQTYQRQ